MKVVVFPAVVEVLGARALLPLCIRQPKLAYVAGESRHSSSGRSCSWCTRPDVAYVSIRQPTPAYASIDVLGTRALGLYHTSAYVSIRQHAPALMSLAHTRW